MTTRCLHPLMLAGLYLLGGWPLIGHCQSVSPMPSPEGHTTPAPILSYPTPSADGEPMSADATGSPLFETARPMTPWYADAEVAFLVNTHVHVNERILAVLPGFNNVYVSPRIFLGYRFDGGGSLRFTYRNLTQVGNLGELGRRDSDSVISAEDTFTTNWFDLDFVSREYAPLSWWRLQWEAGGRFVFRYQGSTFEDPYEHNDSSHTYFGGGPHVGLTSQCLLGNRGCALFGRAETAVTFGGGEVTSRYNPRQPYAGGSWPQAYKASERVGQAQFDLNLQLGLMKRWQMQRYGAGVGVGVQADVLSVGNLGGGDFGMFGLINLGPFLRGEIDF